MVSTRWTQGLAIRRSWVLFSLWNNELFIIYAAMSQTEHGMLVVIKCFCGWESNCSFFDIRLASHWRRVTNLSAYQPTGSWHAKGDMHPPTIQRSMAHLPLLVSCARKLEPILQKIIQTSLHKPTALLAVTGGAPCWRRVACGSLFGTPAADARCRRRHRWIMSKKTPTNTGIATHGMITCITSVPLTAGDSSLPIIYTTPTVCCFIRIEQS